VQQYFQNKILYEDNGDKANPVLEKSEYLDVVFAGYRWDAHAKLDNKVFDDCVFSKLGLKKCCFTHTNLNHSVFISCYFKAGMFRCCDFSGAVFIDCTFDDAVFVDCEFQYAKFKDCYIPFAAMESNLPKNRHNQNRDLCRNLGLEALRAGDDENYRKYYFEEKKASEKYYFKKFCHSKTESGGYYFHKYNVWDGLSGFCHFLLSKLNRWLWGYGERLLRLLSNMCIVVLVYWIIYQTMPIKRSGAALQWYDGLYISLANFITISPVAAYELPKTWEYELASVTEAGIGVVLIGFFVAAVFRYINRRS
jgi:hypothetical protein